jgi:formate--tetrahydrofolate ligase
LSRLAPFCTERGVPSALSEGFAKGGPGAKDLAEKVVAAIEKNAAPSAHPIYSLDESLSEKIRIVAKKVYGADGVNFSDQAKSKLQQFTDWGYGKLPVCIAKTQYSLSDDPKRLGAPTGWTLNVNNASLSAGAGFVVVISGNMMLMPGLPKVSRASSIDVDDSYEILGV